MPSPSLLLAVALAALTQSVFAQDKAAAVGTNVLCENQSTTPLVRLLDKDGKLSNKKSYSYLKCDDYKGFVLNDKADGIVSFFLNDTEITIKDLTLMTGKTVSTLGDIVSLSLGDYVKVISAKGLAYPVELTGVSAKTVVLYAINKDQNGINPDFNAVSAALTRPHRKGGCYYTKSPYLGQLDGHDVCIISYSQVRDPDTRFYGCLKAASDKGCPTCDTCLYQDDDNKAAGLPYLKLNLSGGTQDILKGASIVGAKAGKP